MVGEHWRHLLRKEEWSPVKGSKVCAEADEDKDRTFEMDSGEGVVFPENITLKIQLFGIGFWSTVHYYLVGKTHHSEKLKKLTLQELTQFLEKEYLRSSTIKHAGNSAL